MACFGPMTGHVGGQEREAAMAASLRAGPIHPGQERASTLLEATLTEPRPVPLPSLLGPGLAQAFRPPPGLFLSNGLLAKAGPEALNSLGVRGGTPSKPGPEKAGLWQGSDEGSDCSTTPTQSGASPPADCLPHAPVLCLDTMLTLPASPRSAGGPTQKPSYTPGAVLHAEATVPPPPKQVLELSGSVWVPEVGSAECPSVGSIGHRLGLCKPCDFIHRDSCRTGAACKFCHICGPTENRRRKKEKQRYAKALRQLQGAACGQQPILLA